MNKYFWFFGFAVALVLGLNFNGITQDTTSCKVLLESISGSYDGGCKDGLAHGRGFAEGKDKYKGRFRLGVPDGSGIYYFRNGDYYHGAFKNGKKNGKGDRLFRPEDVKSLQLIHHLLREKKYSIAGAKDFLKKNKKYAKTI